MERREIRLREVAVVVGRLFRAHPVRLAAVVGPAARLLGERLRGVERGRLAVDLVFDRPLDRAERVHVLDLDPGPERLRPALAQRHVRLDPHLAPFHVGVRCADRAQEQLQLLGVAPGLLGRADVGIGHDLHQRCAGAVEVDQADLASIRIGGMDELRGVLLEVRPRDPDGERALRRLDRQPAGRGERQVVLADLVALGQVRVEVVLAVPARGVRGRGLDREAGRQDMLHGTAIDDRQRARQAEADRADVAVRGGAVVGRGAGAEHLRGRPQLAVDLDADDGLVAVTRHRSGLARGCPDGHGGSLAHGRRARVGRRTHGPRTRSIAAPRGVVSALLTTGDMVRHGT